MKRQPHLTELDHRIMRGPRIEATGDDALGWTVAQIMAARCIVYVHCSDARCNEQGYLNCYKLREDGKAESRLAALRPKLRCKDCGGRMPSFSIVDPWRDVPKK